MSNTASQSSSNASLLDRWTALKAETPNLRIRDAAEKLGVTEAELVVLEPEGAVALQGPFGPLIAELESLGQVMALTRNEHAVHEKRGTYRNIEIGQGHALVLDEDIDLRIFPTRWKYGFALEHGAPKKVLASFQFFDEHGTAVHKIFVEDETKMPAFRALRDRFAAKTPSLEISPKKAPASERPDADIDVAKLQTEWNALQDTHDFFALLRRLDVRRTQALRLAGAPLAEAVSTDSLDKVLEGAAATDLPIMVFVGSPACIQIHTGPVKTVKRMGPWMNVLDSKFNLHVKTDGITHAWVVRKPSAEGTVTSLELFDAAGELVVQLFGKRKPGIPELAAWRELTDTLVRLGGQTA